MMRIALGIVCVGVLSVPSYGFTMLYFESAPGTWVGDGQTITATPENGYDFAITNSYHNGIIVNMDNEASAPPEEVHLWSLQLYPIQGDPLVAGTYVDASRISSSANPGLDFSGDYRGFSEIDGHFEILEIEFDGGGNVIKLAADFWAIDAWEPAERVIGSIRYNSEIAIDGVTNLPATNCDGVAGMVGAILILGSIELARRRTRQVA